LTVLPEGTDAIRVGLIGYGYSGKTFHAPLIGATAGLWLNTVASRDTAKVRADLANVQVVADPLDLIQSSDVDLVVIATPNDSHAPLARAALGAGKHVVVDKPFTLTLAEARELRELALQHRRLLAAFQNRRWDSDFLSIRRALADNLIGEVTHFESHIDRFRPEVRRRWREGAGPGSGIWFDLGPHLVDQALQLFGLPDCLHANFARQRAGALADDWAHVVLDYGSRRVILHAGMLVAGGVHRFLIHGTKGSLVKHGADQQEAQLLAGTKPTNADWGADPDDLLLFDGTRGERRIPAVRGDQRQFYTAIAAALRSGGPNPVPADQVVAVVAIIEAAVLAAVSGQRAKLYLTSDERDVWGGRGQIG
jgi:predicted dehydrogenase